MSSINKDPILDSIITRLKVEFGLSKLILFGSRAKNEGSKDSDYDLVAVVQKSSVPRFDREISARVALKDVPAAIDIFVFTESEFIEAKQNLGSVAEIASSEGREISLG